MSFDKHIYGVIDRFFLVTNIPTQAFQLDGHHIHSAGYNDKLDSQYNRHDIYEKVLLEMSHNNSKPIINIPYPNNIHFTACPVCPKNIHRGIFIIGPYSTIPIKDKYIPYKPNYVITYLVSLIRMIWRDSSRKQGHIMEKPIYNLHVRKAIDFIESRYKDNISLDEISDYLNINKSYFCSIFKKETDKTFTEYLNEIRIKKSMELLLEEELSILDIALMVGFNNQNYFNIIFKRITGQTPLEFRQKSLQNRVGGSD